MLSQKAKYALRALLMLAERPPGTMVLAAEIAERQKVPRKFLELILLELKRDGLLVSQRGRNGGYCLARAPAGISFGQVVRLLDGPLAPLPCASVTAYRRCADCHDEHGCHIRLVMRRVRDSMAAILDNATLADALAGRVGDELLEDA
ncbi:Rrf2 family transcriptional regulator [Geminicoccaceae bacterium 1502E]|uniref:Rrf2 family transcriptional regulator n=1 Tax=Marinimicrococcus flavescens TaxID=3031815 RepID=A0AAP3XQ40_9PROT|nr:Rrf2 family transcriptional regulator [Marinimicrococcus flavescens]MDX6748918.1 Rrf2 family transcriptional regulator [Geminicoccaceae bacterium 1502E]